MWSGCRDLNPGPLDPQFRRGEFRSPMLNSEFLQKSRSVGISEYPLESANIRH